MAEKKLEGEEFPEWFKDVNISDNNYYDDDEIEEIAREFKLNDYNIKIETERAFLFILGRREVWLPKSQIRKENGIYIIPEWLVENKKLWKYVSEYIIENYTQKNLLEKF